MNMTVDETSMRKRDGRDLQCSAQYLLYSPVAAYRRIFLFIHISKIFSVQDANKRDYFNTFSMDWHDSDHGIAAQYDYRRNLISEKTLLQILSQQTKQFLSINLTTTKFIDG